MHACTTDVFPAVSYVMLVHVCFVYVVLKITIYVLIAWVAEVHFELHLKWKGKNRGLVGGRSGADNTFY